MISLKNHKTLKWLNDNKITILLISIIVLVILPPFISSEEERIELLMNLFSLPVLISCFLIIRKHPITRFVSIVTFALVIINIFIESYLLDSFQQVGVSILVIHAFSLVIKKAMTLEGTKGKMILISITGYLIIGLLGGFLAEGLERSSPGSYQHSAGLELGLYNFIYYSYVTITTLGYGDIIPITKKSQSLSLILVIAGQLYLAVIIAINISKFLQKKQQEST